MKRMKIGFKTIKLFWRKPDKMVKLATGSILVAAHKGDVNYARYVKFKQLAPQFWERMDSPLFASYLERFENLHNEGKHAQAYAVLRDYGLAIDMVKQEHDAWGLCFALISYEKGEEMEFIPSDIELKEKLDRMTKKGLTPDQIQEGVVDFMRASPETFQDHLILLEVQNMMTVTG